MANAGPGMALDRQGNVYIGQAVGQRVVISTLAPVPSSVVAAPASQYPRVKKPQLRP